MVRCIEDGETLSGRYEDGGYPQIVVCDGQGKGNGRWLFNIKGFNACVVTTQDRITRLVFAGGRRVTIEDCIVEYATGRDGAPRELAVAASNTSGLTRR
jgi:hypothetical protein